jgi:pheromone shutdown protein TraB
MKLTIGNVTLLGTSHVSEKSSKEIKDHCDNSPVDIICVELDEKRYSRMMQGDVGFSVDDIMGMVDKLGVPGFVLSVIISAVQRIIAFLFNLKPGHDMFTAVTYAKQHNKKLVFIDQDAYIKLHNFSKAFTLEEFLGIGPKMFFMSMNDILHPDIELIKGINLKEVPSLEVIRIANKHMKNIMPSFYKAVIEERNRYMAEKILQQQKIMPEAYILVVIGAGHLEGVEAFLKTGE